MAKQVVENSIDLDTNQVAIDRASWLGRHKGQSLAKCRSAPYRPSAVRSGKI
ncbi:hypothetical protein QUB68_15185 [Microcoleus sp. A006_D1]|uniref:hypothetical protein n=1 Tax=Microcoleus sp. A006_D1 TaxID=3055267 RepID=UPI002FCFFA61